MKEITKKEVSRLEKELEQKYYSKDDLPKVNIGESEFSIPRNILNKIEQKMRVYEVDDIKDLKNNYFELTKENIVPFSIVKWMAKIAFDAYKNDPHIKTLMEDAKYEGINDVLRNKKAGFIPKINLNFITIDNLYIDNFRDINKSAFDACEFDLFDMHGERIEGVMIYRKYSYRVNEKLLEKIQMAKSANGATAFDITTQALPETYLDLPIKREIRADKKLHILDIRYNREAKSDIEVSPDGSFVGNPVFSGVFS